MANVQIDFCRRMLKAVTAEARERFSIKTRSAAWSIRIDSKTFEFHINKCEQFPAGFYWYGRADNAYEAKATGWSKAIIEFDSRQLGERL